MRERAVAGGGGEEEMETRRWCVERKDRRLRNREQGIVNRLVETREEEKKE